MKHLLKNLLAISLFYFVSCQASQPEKKPRFSNVCVSVDTKITHKQRANATLFNGASVVTVRDLTIDENNEKAYSGLITLIHSRYMYPKDAMRTHNQIIALLGAQLTGQANLDDFMHE